MNQSTDKRFDDSGVLIDWMLSQKQYRPGGIARAIAASEEKGSWEDQWIRITYQAGIYIVSFLQ